MLADINFIETNAQTINTKLINDFEASLGETLYPGDERRIFLQQQTAIIVGLKNDINDSAKQNLLRYARGEKLDAVAEDFFYTKRLQAQRASCPGKVKLVAVQNIDTPIAKGKRITPDGVLFFAIREDTVVPAGQLEADVTLEATETGSKYNKLLPGQIKNIVDPIPFVESIVNTDTSNGGADLEDDDSYRERCRLAPESYSSAGPEGAYEYYAKSADSSISDVKIISPSPGTVRVIVLLKNGEIPSQDILNKVYAECSPRGRRPLTDKVETGAPTVVTYNIELTYYLDKEHQTEELKYRKAIEGDNLDCSTGAIRDYINWQQSKLGKSLNPDELRYRIQNAATYSVENKSYTVVRRIILNNPTYTEVQETEVAKVGTITINYGGLE